MDYWPDDWRTRAAIYFLALFIVVFTTTLAVAQEQRPPMKPCDTIANQLAYVEKWYGETPVGTATMGVNQEETEVIWTFSAEKGDWTMFYIRPDTGEACMFAGGEHMTFLESSWGAQI